MKNALLFIDLQEDFCNKDKGSHFIEGADVAAVKASGFLDANIDSVDAVVFFNDSHNVVDISHPTYWVDVEGNHLEPYTTVSHKEARGRRYTAYMPGVPEEVLLEKHKLAVEYLKDLESIGKKHTIWPEHCVAGTFGYSIEEKLMNSTLEWSRKKGRDIVTLNKGMYPHNENFGALEAAVPDANVPETTSIGSHNVMGYLDNFQTVYVFASDVNGCFVHTLEQIMNLTTHDPMFADLITRYKIVEDVMGDSKRDETKNKAILDKAKKMGFEFVSINEIKL